MSKKSQLKINLFALLIFFFCNKSFQNCVIYAIIHESEALKYSIQARIQRSADLGMSERILLSFPGSRRSPSTRSLDRISARGQETQSR